MHAVAADVLATSHAAGPCQRLCVSVAVKAGPRLVTIPYDRLADPLADLSAEIEESYGLDGLGFLTISGVPTFPEYRSRLLKLDSQFAVSSIVTTANVCIKCAYALCILPVCFSKMY